jgi:glutathione S-transferase
MQPLLTYFNVRGRAEVIRLILEEKQVAYRERRVALEEWPTLKPRLLMGHLPTYEDGELLITQSQAIYRHLARTLDLYGDDEREHIRCDTVVDACNDAQVSIMTFFWSPDFAAKRSEYESTQLPFLLERLTRLYEQNREGTADWAGSRLSYADFVAWHFLDCVRPFSQGTLEKFAELAAFKRRFEARPRIATYLASPRRPATITVSRASFGGSPETS